MGRSIKFVYLDYFTDNFVSVFPVGVHLVFHFKVPRTSFKGVKVYLDLHNFVVRIFEGGCKV